MYTTVLWLHFFINGPQRYVHAVISSFFLLVIKRCNNKLKNGKIFEMADLSEDYCTDAADGGKFSSSSSDDAADKSLDFPDVDKFVLSSVEGR